MWLTNYALRVLMYITVNGEGLATIRETAERYGILNSHLTRVDRDLGRAGFGETVRGRGGGLRLARSAPTLLI